MPKNDDEIEDDGGADHFWRARAYLPPATSKMMKPINAISLALLLLLCREASGNASYASHRHQPLAAVLPTSVFKNLAKGSFLKCAADLTGGLVSVN